MSRIYYSVDIETDGLAPGINSMISLGVAAIDMVTGEIVGTFKRNLYPVEYLEQDPDTMRWWRTQPEAYKRSTENCTVPRLAMVELMTFVESFGQQQPVAAAWKPGFDLAFLRYYEIKYLGKMIFGRAGSGLDIKTVAALALGQAFNDTHLDKVPDWLKIPNSTVHTHDALEDAVEQAHILYNALNNPASNLVQKSRYEYFPPL